MSLAARSTSPFVDLVVTHAGKRFTGKAVLGSSWLRAANPIVLCFPDVMGCKSIDMHRCLHLAQLLGCAAVAVDLYGDAFPMHKREDRANIHEAFVFMNSLLCDPTNLRQLMRAYIDAAVKQLNGDPNRVAALGFCFGGACVLEMLRDGAPVRAVVSMHGTLDARPLAGLDGKPAPEMKTEKPAPRHTAGAHVLVCHGEADPLVPSPVVVAFQAEMAKAPIASCTLSSYTRVVHAFTAPTQDTPNAVIAFNADAARRAWVSAIDLFAQVFDVNVQRPISRELWTDTLILPRL